MALAIAAERYEVVRALFRRHGAKAPFLLWQPRAVELNSPALIELVRWWSALPRAGRVPEAARASIVLPPTVADHVVVAEPAADGTGFLCSRRDGSLDNVAVPEGHEALFIADSTLQTPSIGIATIDTQSFALDFIAPFPPDNQSTGVELTGTGDGRLFGFFVGGQVLAGILGSTVTFGYGPEGKHGANFMQTAAASVAGMAGMGVLLQAMLWMGLPQPPAWQLMLFMGAIGMYGAGVGMLYTPILVDRLEPELVGAEGPGLLLAVGDGDDEDGDVGGVGAPLDLGEEAPRGLALEHDVEDDRGGARRGERERSKASSKVSRAPERWRAPGPAPSRSPAPAGSRAS